MIALREQIEKDLIDTIEGEFRMTVELTSPDGEKQTMSKNNPTEKLYGYSRYSSLSLNPETGEMTIVNKPVMILRITSLNRVPVSGERWFIKFATSPVAGSPLQSFVFTPDRAIEHGQDIGFIKIYPQRIENTGGPEPVS